MKERGEYKRQAVYNRVYNPRQEEIDKDEMAADGSRQQHSCNKQRYPNLTPDGLKNNEQ